MLDKSYSFLRRCLKSMVCRYCAYINIFEEEVNSTHGRQGSERAKLGTVGKLSHRIWSGAPKIPQCSQTCQYPPVSPAEGLVHLAASHYCSPVRLAGEVVHPVPPQYFRARQVSEAGDASEVRYQPGFVDGANWTGLCWASQVGPTVPIRLAGPGLLGCLGGAWHGWHG